MGHLNYENEPGFFANAAEHMRDMYNMVRENPREAMAVFSVTALAAATPQLAHAQEQTPAGEGSGDESAETARPDWPAITFEGAPEGSFEQNMADFCANGHATNPPVVDPIKRHRTDNDAVRAFVDNESVMDCNGKGRRTVTLTMLTKRPGQSEYKKGEPRVIASHKGFSKYLKLDTAHSSSTVRARVQVKVKYENYDGEIIRHTTKSHPTTISR